jgi:hypothetical protein
MTHSLFKIPPTDFSMLVPLLTPPFFFHSLIPIRSCLTPCNTATNDLTCLSVCLFGTQHQELPTFRQCLPKKLFQYIWVWAHLGAAQKEKLVNNWLFDKKIISGNPANTTAATSAIMFTAPPVKSRGEREREREGEEEEVKPLKPHTPLLYCGCNTHPPIL